MSVVTILNPDAIGPNSVSISKLNRDARCPIISQSAASVSINPNCMNVWGEMASLTISLATPVDPSVMNVYAFRFISGASATSVTWPAGITWAGGTAPTIAASKTYEVTICDNKATVLEF